MKILNFLLISFLLLAPTEYLGKPGVRGIFGQSVTNYDVRKESGNFTSPFYNVQYHQQECPRTPQESRQPMVVKVRYEMTPEENCEANRKKTNEGEFRFGNEAAEKWKTNLQEKTRNQEGKTCRRPENVLDQNHYLKDRYACTSEAKKGETLCADCDKCEIQIKSSGDGVVLKCQQCRHVSSDQTAIISGTNHKVIRLP